MSPPRRVKKKQISLLAFLLTANKIKHCSQLTLILYASAGTYPSARLEDQQTVNLINLKHLECKSDVLIISGNGEGQPGAPVKAGNGAQRNDRIVWRVRSRRSTSLRSGLSSRIPFFKHISTSDILLQAVLESLQLASEKRLVREFDRVIDRLVAVKNDPKIKSGLEPLARYAMSVAKIGTEQIGRALSKVLSEREANKMAMSTGERLYLEGEVKGRAEGKAETGRNMVLSALRTKFKRVPKDIERSVLAMSDSIALESLLVQAIHSETLDEFTEVLRGKSPGVSRGEQNRNLTIAALLPIRLT